MKTSTKLTLLAACLTSALSAQTLLTNFSTTAGFGSSSTLAGTGSAISVSGGAGNYTVSGPGESDFSYIQYTGAVGSYTSNWSVRVDTNYVTPGSIFNSGVPQFINLGLLVVKTGTTLSISDDAPTFHGFEVASNLYNDNLNNATRDFRTSVFGPGTFQDSTVYGSSSVSGATSSTIRLSFDVSTHALSGFYDADGAAGGYSFTFMPALGELTNTWGMTASDTFSIYLIGNSGYDGNLTGVGPDITAGQATFDNLTGISVTAVPEPSTYAAIAGLGALGLAFRRRRQTQRA